MTAVGDGPHVVAVLAQSGCQQLQIRRRIVHNQNISPMGVQVHGEYNGEEGLFGVLVYWCSGLFNTLIHH